MRDDLFRDMLVLSWRKQNKTTNKILLCILKNHNVFSYFPIVMRSIKGFLYKTKFVDMTN